MKRVLVTGGTGYIGSHTVVELQEAGYEVLIIDNLSRSRKETIDGITEITGVKPAFTQLDLKNRNAVLDYFTTNGNIDAIIHFAAYKAVGESVEKPLLYYQNNLLGLINLLEGMQQADIHNIVFSSSCTVYGQPDSLPVTEQAPIKNAESPYGNTKQISEEILQDIVKTGVGISAIALRYFNPIGAHESSKIGELPLGVPDNLVPYVTQTAYGLRKELRVFGSDYNTPDGSAVRDYIHVMDLAQAHVVAIDRLLNARNKKPYEYFNLGTGQGSTVLEVIRTFEEVTGVKLNYAITARRQGDVEQVWADTKFANEELGWTARRTLGEALASAWNWEKEFRSRSMFKNY